MTDHPTFPAIGRPVDELVAEIRGGRGDDADWRAGRTFSLVYNAADPELERLHEAVAHEYLHENYLNPFAFPSLLRMEREVVAMGADLLHGDPRAGKLTSGGTESIFLAVQVARDHARAERGIAEPAIVLPETAHPAFAKACHYLDVTEVRVPVGPDGRADLAATAAAVDDRTALVVGSAPCYPFGVVDPIPELATLAAERGALCHVDACLGGWLLPFLERLGEPVPPWDMRVEGVTSLSADVHKYGWSFKGASLLLHRDEDLLKRQYFLFDGWPGGLYGSATTAGTRPAAPIAAAWATVRYLGMEGYLRLADQVRAASARFRAGIEAIDGLHVTGDPVPGIMEIAADPGSGIDMGAVGDVMDDRGWHLDRQQGGLHAIISPSHLAAADAFLADLADAVAHHGPSRGVEARYGGVG
ncbi:MAG: aminotransferase class V-fold PLP-dependent enzyme [Thermoanaerobacterales bacterium]|nr:aspartate aminotransferase family protein [Thermoanaerobacterales bacterium]